MMDRCLYLNQNQNLNQSLNQNQEEVPVGRLQPEPKGSEMGLFI